MNREIKFRGNRVDGKGWFYGMLCQYQGKLYISKEFIEYPTFYDPSGSWIYNEYEVDPTTVGQYTGLKDKNGVEIYEGDILKFPFGRIAYVINDGFQIGLKSPGSESVSYEYKEMYEVCQIIGNIHQNPELI